MKKLLSMALSIIIAVSVSCLYAAGKSSDKFPLKVTDGTGYKMTITKKPSRIVSTTLATDEVLFGIADKKRIAAINRTSADPGISNIADEAKKFPTRIEALVEKIIAVKPDLVLVSDWQKKEFVQQLRDAKINVYQYKSPSTIDEQKKMIMQIAEVIGEKAKGKELVSWMDKKLKSVEDRVKKISPKKKLKVIKYYSNGVTDGKNTSFDEVVTKAGLINAAAQAGLTGWPNISKEKIIELNPDIIVVPSWSYDKEHSAEDFANSLYKDESLKSVNAIKNKKVIMLPDNHMGALSQYIVLGVEDAAKAAYPELFK